MDAPRSFAQPPIELQAVIETVAQIVAEQGPTVEFRLRSGEDGRHQYPFLFLDDEYAPFYQSRLRDMRMKQKANKIAINTNTFPTTKCSDASLGMQRQNPQIEIDDTRLAEDGDLRKLHAYTQHSETCHSNQNSCIDREGGTTQNRKSTEKADNFQENQAKFARSPSDSNSQRCPPAAETPLNLHFDPPYGLLQEVHLLDSSGFERSGLNTFVVVGNTDEEPEDPLISYFFQLPDHVPQREPIYRLRPDTSAVFRASHNRLLPVGLPLGAEVQQPNKIAFGIVVRRTVLERQRFYDVKDVNGIVHKDIAEEHLELHNGGTFNFRLPNELGTGENNSSTS